MSNLDDLSESLSLNRFQSTRISELSELSEYNSIEERPQNEGAETTIEPITDAFALQIDTANDLLG